MLSKVNVFGEGAGNVNNIQSAVEKLFFLVLHVFIKSRQYGIFAASEIRIRERSSKLRIKPSKDSKHKINILLIHLLWP
jgi:hypothetical protein